MNTAMAVNASKVVAPFVSLVQDLPSTAFRNRKPIRDVRLMKRSWRNLRATSGSMASCSLSSSVLCRTARMVSLNSWPGRGATALHNSPSGKPFPQAFENSPTRNASNCN